MIFGEEKLKKPFLDNLEKFFWQLLVGLIIIDLPIIIITTSPDKIIWVMIYTLIILIVITLFSIIKRLL